LASGKYVAAQPFRRGVGHQAQFVGLPVVAAEGADQVYKIAVLETELGQVFGVDEEDAAAAGDPRYRSSKP
jgi:hypothetical protein